jgi:chromosome condensin MukBEF ATPase and DNA-binding subunit MukB
MSKVAMEQSLLRALLCGLADISFGVPATVWTTIEVKRSYAYVVDGTEKLSTYENRKADIPIA